MSGGGVGSAWTVPSARDVATPLKDDSRDDVAPVADTARLGARLANHLPVARFSSRSTGCGFMGARDGAAKFSSARFTPSCSRDGQPHPMPHLTLPHRVQLLRIVPIRQH